MNGSSHQKRGNCSQDNNWITGLSGGNYHEPSPKPNYGRGTAHVSINIGDKQQQAILEFWQFPIVIIIRSEDNLYREIRLTVDPKGQVIRQLTGDY